MPAFWSCVAEWLLAILLLCGSLFALAGAIGLLRFPDVYMRLHAPALPATVGLGCLLTASMGSHLLFGSAHHAELLIAGLIFMTAPISTNLLAQAALSQSAASLSPLPESVSRAQDLQDRQAERAQ